MSNVSNRWDSCLCFSEQWFYLGVYIIHRIIVSNNKTIDVENDVSNYIICKDFIAMISDLIGYE